MADRPLSAPLPADLPEDWTDGQIVAPSGASVGLSERHGYNYLMEMVNRAQEAVNTINEGFDNISGKRTCRFVVGTSTAGWTQADCDYLCDGTDDQEEINEACSAGSGNGEIVLLPGTYYITGPITISYGRTLRGNGIDATNLRFENGVFSEDTEAAVMCYGSICSLTVNCTVSENDESKPFIKTSRDFSRLENIRFFMSGAVRTAIYATNGSIAVHGCFFPVGGFRTAALHAKMDGDVVSGERVVQFSNNFCSYCESIVVDGPSNGFSAPKVLIVGNTGNLGLKIKLDSVFTGSAIIGNIVEELDLLNTSANGITSKGVIIAGNNFSALASGKTVLTLGENTRGNFVTGNNLFNTGENTQHQVQDLGIQNVIRFNSNDTEGGSGAAGVSSFNGRAGAVLPASGDYTAAMVGAVSSGNVAAVQAVTQAEYDALTQKDPDTLYLIQG